MLALWNTQALSIELKKGDAVVAESENGLNIKIKSLSKYSPGNYIIIIIYNYRGIFYQNWYFLYQILSAIMKINGYNY